MNKVAANNSRERTEYTISKTFFNDEHEFSEDVTIYMPFEMVMETMSQYCNTNYDVNIEGSNLNLWNLFGNTSFLDDLFGDADFLEALEQSYDNSIYSELDYFEWVDEEPWEDYDDSSKHVLEPGLYIED